MRMYESSEWSKSISLDTAGYHGVIDILDKFSVIKVSLRCNDMVCDTYVHAYIHACMHTYIHACMHAYIHTYIYIHTYVRTYIHTYITHTCMRISHMYKYLHVIVLCLFNILVYCYSYFC